MLDGIVRNVDAALHIATGDSGSSKIESREAQHQIIDNYA